MLFSSLELQPMLTLYVRITWNSISVHELLVTIRTSCVPGLHIRSCLDRSVEQVILHGLSYCLKPLLSEIWHQQLLGAFDSYLRRTVDDTRRR